MTLSFWLSLEGENVGGGRDVFLKAVVVGVAGHGAFLSLGAHGGHLEGGSGHHTWWLTAQTSLANLGSSGEVLESFSSVTWLGGGETAGYLLSGLTLGHIWSHDQKSASSHFCLCHGHPLCQDRSCRSPSD